MSIRPPDPLVTTPTLACAPYGSHEAVRRLLQLCYRDCLTVLDLTYGGGGFWGAALPPGIALTANVWPDTVGPVVALGGFGGGSLVSVDFRHTRLADDAYDLVIYDPPHVADGGADGLYAGRYGTARGTRALRALLVDGLLEALRLASAGVLVKVTDHAHGGEWLPLTYWVHDAISNEASLYCTLHTYRAPTVDPKWRVQRVPRSNGATYLAYRKLGPRHRDFDAEYARQEARRA